jgi:hypothetical protein
MSYVDQICHGRHHGRIDHSDRKAKSSIGYDQTINAFSGRNLVETIYFRVQLNLPYICWVLTNSKDKPMIIRPIIEQSQLLNKKISLDAGKIIHRPVFLPSHSVRNRSKKIGTDQVRYASRQEGRT